MPAIELVVCMGSACFSRGNLKTLDLIQRYLKAHDLDQTVHVTGTLCQDRCRRGPNVSVEGLCFCGLTPEAVLERVEAQLGVAS